ncbi:hypothetical protein AB0O47_32580 [Streptomyces noursei]|uniref:hypothetical protein n=1 Tax=Streptomyces noursei TaxID=1971 RepID=UPI00344C283B
MGVIALPTTASAAVLAVPGVVTREDLGPLPADVDPGLVRVARADAVRGGDLVVGYFDDAPGRRRMPAAHVGELCYRALPAQHPLGWDVLTLDGTLFQWSPQDTVLVIPREWAPTVYRPGDRVERIAQPRRKGTAAHHRFTQHGTVADTEDGTVTVRWDGDWLPTTVPADHVRHVDPEIVADDRLTYGFAHGDTVTAPGRPDSKGTVVYLWCNSAGDMTAHVVWENDAPSDEPVHSLLPAVALSAA